jgi:hypothetical protein
VVFGANAVIHPCAVMIKPEKLTNSEDVYKLGNTAVTLSAMFGPCWLVNL